MKIPLRVRNFNSGFLECLIHGDIHRVGSLEEFDCRHPIAVADVDGRIGKFLNTNLRLRILNDFGKRIQRISNSLNRRVRITVIADSDDGLDNSILPRIVNDFADDVFIRNGTRETSVSRVPLRRLNTAKK